MTRTTGLGMLVLGILFLGGQLVLSMGAKRGVQPVAGESHPMPRKRETPPILGAFGGIALVAGIVVVTFGRTGKNEDKSVPPEE